MTVRFFEIYRIPMDFGKSQDLDLFVDFTEKQSFRKISNPLYFTSLLFDSSCVIIL